MISATPTFIEMNTKIECWASILLPRTEVSRTLLLFFYWVTINQHLRRFPLFLLRLRLLLLFLFLLIITSLVLCYIVCNIPVSDSQNEKKPEYVDSLQTSEEGKCNVLRNPALILLGFPIEFKRTDSGKFSEDGPKDAEVNKVAEIDPYTDEQAIKGTNKYGVKIIENFG